MNERAKLTDQELREAAAEAGISPAELRQALAQRSSGAPSSALARSAGTAAQVYSAGTQLALPPDRAAETVRAAIARQIGHRGHRQGNGDIDILDDRAGMLYRIRSESDGQGGALIEVRSERSGNNLALATMMFSSVAVGVIVLGIMISTIVMMLGIGLLVSSVFAIVMAGRRAAGMQKQAELVVAQALVEAEEDVPLTAGPPRALAPE